MVTAYDFTVNDINGRPVDLGAYRGKPLLIVNTASRCGFTPQYAGLQALHDSYQARGLQVLGFPCNQFGGQEPGTADEIAQFCDLNFGVSFPLFAKVDVNGTHAAPLFVHLKQAAPGILGSEAIKWNFTKFLVSPDGAVQRFAPKDAPESLRPAIEQILAAANNV